MPFCLAVIPTSKSFFFTKQNFFQLSFNLCMFAKKNDKDLIYGSSGHLFQLSKVREIISVLTNEKVFIYKTSC